MAAQRGRAGAIGALAGEVMAKDLASVKLTSLPSVACTIVQCKILSSSCRQVRITRACSSETVAI